MEYRITSVCTPKETNYTCVDVEFADGDRIIHKNDFVLDIRPTYLEYTGRYDPDGEMLDETFAEYHTDIEAVVKREIEEYARSALIVERKIDSRDRLIEREPIDPLNIHSVLKGLIGQPIAVLDTI